MRQSKCSVSSPFGDMSTCIITTIQLTCLTHSVRAIWVLSSVEIQQGFSNSARLDCTEAGASNMNITIVRADWEAAHGEEMARGSGGEDNDGFSQASCRQKWMGDLNHKLM